MLDIGISDRLDFFILNGLVGRLGKKLEFDLVSDVGPEPLFKQPDGGSALAEARENRFFF
jgi:hypothetical protein